jgi:hypothetical protein
MRVVKEINAFQKGFNSVQKGGKFGPDAAGNWLKNKFTGKDDKDKDTHNYTHWFIDGKGVRWSFDSKKKVWISKDGNIIKKEAGVKAYNQARKRSNPEFTLKTESKMARYTNEGLGDLAHVVEKDHEVQMARAQLYKIAKHSIQLHEMMQGMDPDTDLESWVQAKLTKAADYIDAVYHHLDAKKAEAGMELEVLEAAIQRVRSGSSDNYKATLEAKMNTKYLKGKGLTGDKAKDSKAYAKPRGKMPPPTTVMKNKKSDKHDARGKIKDVD